MKIQEKISQATNELELNEIVNNITDLELKKELERVLNEDYHYYESGVNILNSYKINLINKINDYEEEK